ncbi:MAG: YqzL family protein [Negativicutes bacterium]
MCCGLETADFYWKLFETTGSIAAYLVYKQLKELSV